MRRIDPRVPDYEWCCRQKYRRPPWSTSILFELSLAAATAGSPLFRRSRFLWRQVSPSLGIWLGIGDRSAMLEPITAISFYSLSEIVTTMILK